MRKAEWRSMLLTTSSLAAVVLGWSGAAEANSCSASNPATPFVNSGPIDCITFNDGLNHVGDVTNTSTGVITPPGLPGSPGVLTGIGVIGGSTLTGNIVNNGTITGSVEAGLNIGLNNAPSFLTGSVTNNGSITSAGFGIGVNGNVGGDVVNNNILNTAFSGIVVSGVGVVATVGGSVVNNGSITVTPTGGVTAFGINVFNASIAGSVVNTNSITMTGQTAIAVSN